MKKMLAILAILLLVVSSQGVFNNAQAAPDADPEFKLAQTLLKPESPKEKVRVIIELLEEPTIETASKQGVLYKELPDNQKQLIESAAVAKQETVQTAITGVAPKIDYLQTFTTVFNGFSAEVEAGQVAKIAELPSVKAVYEATEYKRPDIEPTMKYSKELVQAQQAWNDYGFKGEGMIVGVIDTGIDPGHRDMVLTNNATAALTQEEVEAFVSDSEIEEGQFFTPKVPFGYNYMDANTEIRDIAPGASMHGMHVAGTVGANGNEENGGIKGVAPETQLLALKVFGNDANYATTFGDIYIKAIDDSIKLGADVINMSLGATAGFVDTSSPEQQAVERATNNGILVAISAGNEDLRGSGFLAPFAENQDYGLIGTPGTAVDSLGVASFENSTITTDSFVYQVDGTQAERALYLLANDVPPESLPADSYGVVEVGLGQPADFEGKDVNGKFALIARGTIPFTEKAFVAQSAGAAGVIIYNNTTGPVNMESDPSITIPFLSTLQADGLAMKAALDAGQAVTVAFDGQKLETPNPNAGKMSDFTSWGPTPNLDFKPEITAPGGNIFSTFNDDEYGLMSGTSMAAPHVAGGTALMFQRIEELGLNGRDRVEFAKNLLMNTANPVELVAGQFVSPRRQGAGLMQLHDALSTDVMLTDQASGDAKVALKEIDNNQMAMTLQAENFSDQPATYTVAVNAQTDYVTKHPERKIDITDPNRAGANDVTDLVNITAPDTVTVPANGTAEIQVTIDAKALQGRPEFAAFTNGYFIDGFITLTDGNEEVSGNTPLAVPYFGFNGEWDDAPIFDDVAWDPGTVFATTFLTDDFGRIITGGSHQQGFAPERFAFSPNGDGSRESIVPVFSLLRNAKALEVNILDADGNKLRTLQSAKDLVKNFTENFSYYYDPLNEWNGRVLGETVEDGQYQLQVRAVIDYPDAEWRSLTIPILVDTVSPTADATLDAQTKTVTVSSFADNAGGGGADRWEVFLNGVELTENPDTFEDESLAPSTTSYVVPVDIKAGDVLKAVFHDTAGNRTEVPLTDSPADTEKPAVSIIAPGLFEVLSTKRVEVFGSAEDSSRIVSVTVNGEKVDRFDGVFFMHTLMLDDGRHDIFAKAIDEPGNELEVRSQVLVDTQPAVLELLDVPETVEADSAEVTFNVTDNMDAIKVYLIDDEVYSQDMTEPYGESRFDEDITITVPVADPGDNDFTLKVIDAAGHITEEGFTITKQ